jgi:hypothetical protein
LRIDLLEALLGFGKEIRTLDGRYISVEKNNIT